MDRSSPGHELDRLRRELGDQYAVVRLIGRGGMGAVYLARELSLDRLVALKVLPASADDEATRERFRREARMVARLNHPGIVPLYAYGETETTLYYAMAYVDGESLAQRLERDGPLSGPETRDLLTQVASALDHAHRRGLIHRDIKPSNVLIDGASGRILVTDFGIGRALGSPVAGSGRIPGDAGAGDPHQGEGLTGETGDGPQSDPGGSAGLTRVGETVGTPKYMAPEQATGSEVDARTDLYALGLTAYEAAVGRGPFEARDPQALLAKKLTGDFEPLTRTRPDLDGRVAALVDRCLATDPDRRPETADRVLALLADDAPPSGPMDLLPGSASRWEALRGGRRWRGLVPLALVAAAAWAWNGFPTGARSDAREDLPTEAVTLYSRALVFADEGRVAEARILLDTVVARYPEFEEARSLLGRLPDEGFDEDVPVIIARLREAIFSGSFDEAERLVDEVVDASGVSRARKIQVLRHAARDFVREYSEPAARRAIDRMLALEPPLVMLHPGIEPPELMALYGAARRARAGGAVPALDLDSVVVSIGAFAVTGFEDTTASVLQEGIGTVVTTELSGSVRLVDRGTEFLLQYDGGAGSDGAGPSAGEIDGFYDRYDAAMAGRLGEALPETHIVYGSLAARGNRVLVGLWAVSVDEAVVVGFAQAEGALPDGLLDAVERASRGLLENLGLR